MIFIDAGAFVARHRLSDRWHKEAIAAWTNLESSGETIATSTATLYEALNLIGRYAGYEKVIWLAEQIFASKLKILRPTSDDELLALMFARKLVEHKIGFIDCLSFSLMKRYKITTALSFDRHFHYAGFELFTEID